MSSYQFQLDIPNLQTLPCIFELCYIYRRTHVVNLLYKDTPKAFVLIWNNFEVL